jgi:L-fuculose-phosphate aldolase
MVEQSRTDDGIVDSRIATTFSEIGRDIFLRGLISSHAGNMSVRIGTKMLLTRRGSMLGRLGPSDLVELAIEGEDSRILMASSEVVVHRAIYRNTGALAIVHTHPPYATLLSMTSDGITPIDSEGSYLFKHVPVVTAEKTIGSAEASVLISEALRDCKVVLLRGHGSFARGDTLEEAYMYTSSLESSAFFVFHQSGDKKEYRRYSNQYTKW